MPFGAQAAKGGQMGCVEAFGRAGQRAGQRAKGVGRLVKSYPLIVIVPILLLGLVLGLGVWGVTSVYDTTVQSAKSRAESLALAAASFYQQQLTQANAPLLLMAALVDYNPQWAAVDELFSGLAPAMLAQTPPGTTRLLEMLPNGVVHGMYPLEGNEAAMGLDIFASPVDRDSVLRSVAARAPKLVGPIPLGVDDFGIIVQNPIFVSGVDEDETFGHPSPINAACGAPCAYNATTRTKFWGFAATAISLSTLRDPGSQLLQLEARGYAWEIHAPHPITGQLVKVVQSNGSFGGDPVTVPVSALDSHWALVLAPRDGWGAAWYGGLLAGVVALAVAVGLLSFAMLISRRQHQVLLEAVLPKEMIKQLKEEDASCMQPRMLPADTPADVLLGMMRELMDGTMPDLRDVVFIRTTLMRNMDVYRPLNLKNYLRGSSLDNDVVRALMRQLGTGRENEDGASNYSGGEENSRDLCSIDDEGGEGGQGAEAAAGHCSTVSATLQLIFTMQPHSLLVASETHSADGTATPDEKELPPADDRASSGRELRGGGAGCNSRWRSRKSGQGVQVVMSANGRTSAPNAPLPLSLQASIVEEVERLLAGVDSWHFDTWKLQEATQGHALSSLGFFIMQREGLVKRFRLKPVTLARLLRQVESGYLDNPYHNATHAADVLQTLHVIIHAAQLHVHYLDPLGLLAAYYAAIVHDYAHPGLTGDFLVATSDHLAVRYNDRSPLENHHCAASFALLARPELDAFAPLSKAERGAFRKQVIELVLATDMKQHFSIISHFNTVHRLTSYNQQQAAAALAPSTSLARAVSLRPPSGAFATVVRMPSGEKASLNSRKTAPQPVDDTERLLTLQLALKAADIGHLGEEIEVHKRWLSVLEEEFFMQGDREKQLGLPISPLFDRAKQGVSKSQVGFYDFVGLPLVHALSGAFPGTLPLMRCFANNYNHWRSVEGQPPLEAAAAPSGASKPGGGGAAAGGKVMMPAPTGRRGPSPSPTVARLATCSEASPQTPQTASAPAVSVVVSD